MVDDISHEGLRVLLREEGVSFQAIKTWKQSNDPDFEAKKNRVLELYAIADGKAEPATATPTVVFCMDEFGPLNLQPHPDKQWAARDGHDPDRPPRRRRRATYKRPHGVRHLLAANNVELAYVPFYASWLNRIEAQFTALRYFALDGTDHDSHEAQGRMIPATSPGATATLTTAHSENSSNARCLTRH